MKKLSGTTQRNLLIAIIIAIVSAAAFLWKCIPNGDDCSSYECKVTIAMIIALSRKIELNYI